MLDRLHEQRKAIQLYFMRQNKRNLDLSEGEWNLVAECTLFLKPFYEATNMFCQDDAPISLQFPIAKMLYLNLQNLECSNALVAVKEKMCSLLKTKFFDLENQKYALIYRILIQSF